MNFESHDILQTNTHEVMHPSWLKLPSQKNTIDWKCTSASEIFNLPFQKQAVCTIRSCGKVMFSQLFVCSQYGGYMGERESQPPRTWHLPHTLANGRYASHGNVFLLQMSSYFRLFGTYLVREQRQQRTRYCGKHSNICLQIFMQNNSCQFMFKF